MSLNVFVALRTIRSSELVGLAVFPLNTNDCADMRRRELERFLKGNSSYNVQKI